MRSTLQDLGMSVTVSVWTDASATLGIVNMSGAGKLRHIQVGWLWIQQKARDKYIRYRMVKGEEKQQIS